MPPETDQRPVRGNSPEAVKGWLDGQGYAVEHRVATHLARRRWVARQGLTYRDPTTAKTREVDVAARALLEGAIELHLVVECKRSAKAWVTRTTSSAVLQKGRVTWRPVASSLVHELLEAQPNILRSLPINRQVPFDVVEAWHERRDENQNPAHNALSRVVSGAVGLLSNADQFPNPALMHRSWCSKGAYSPHPSPMTARRRSSRSNGSAFIGAARQTSQPRSSLTW